MKQKLVRKIAETRFKQEGASGRKFTFTFSSADVDRDNDTIAQFGINLEAFSKNPVVLWAHRMDVPPVARVSKTWIRGGKLTGSIQFPEPGTSELSDTVRKLVEQNFLTAVSIGFNPTRYKYNESRQGYDFEEVDLLELSLVPVPSNPNALLQAVEKGIDVGSLVDSYEKWKPPESATLNRNLVSRTAAKAQAKKLIHDELDAAALDLVLQHSGCLDITEVKRRARTDPRFAKGVQALLSKTREISESVFDSISRELT